VWTFRLRRGVTFQAPVSREVTAADVVADVRFIVDPVNESPVSYMYAVLKGTDDNGNAAPGDVAVRALDRYTVRFTLKDPYAAFPDTLGAASAWVWPEDHLRRVGRARFEQQPVGTGPFVLSRRVAGRSVDLRRNPGWWNAGSGRPYLEAVHFRVFESVAAGLRAFQEGLLDYTWVPHGQVAASRALPQVKSGEWSARRLPTLGERFVGFDWEDPVTGGAQGLTIRRAIACAIDRADLVTAVYDGIYLPQTGLVPPVLAGWNEDVPAQTYDPAEAARLYEAAGSPRLRIVCWSELREAVETGRWLQAACARAGIPLEVKLMTLEQIGALWGTRRMPAMYLTGWLADYPAADSFLYDLFHSSMGMIGGMSYSDPDVDRLLTLARSTGDPARHYELDRRAAAEIMADLPVIPLIEFADYRLTSERVGGFGADPLGFVDMSELWVR
jgi:ABC-type transport system substrate-binding protein